MPLSPRQTRESLGRIAHRPNKKLGQNFLVDGNLVRKSLDLAEIRPGNSVAEIGPGLGTLTGALLEAGAEVYAVERDAALVRHLQEALGDEPKLHLIEGDCLDHPRAGYAAAGPLKIVANLPYAVSTPWVEAVVAGPLPKRMVLMLQKEAADRYVAPHGGKSFGAVSIFLQSAYTVRSQHKVSAACFHPAPKVDSTLLRLDRKPDAFQFPEDVRACIRRIFTQRRKQLGALCRKDPFAPAKTWFENLTAAGVSPSARPEAIPVDLWRTLAG